MTTAPVPDAAPPLLDDAQFTRLAALGERRAVHAGDVLIAPGELDYPFHLIEAGEVEVVRAATPDRPELVLRTWGAGAFTGEWSLVTGQAAFVTVRASTTGFVVEIPRGRILEALAADADLSNAIVRELLRRREVLRTGEGAASVEILGRANSAAAHQLRTWAERQRLAFIWLDVDEPAGASLARELGCTNGDLPIVVTPTATIPRATVGQLSENLGLTYRASGATHELVVVGAGPAGLAAAVYGASEGLSTLLLDGVATGGQAAASSRIENYLGFPGGISGGDLTSRGLIQAQRFGALVYTPCAVDDLQADGGGFRLTLTDGTEVPARSVVIATGAHYRRLPLECWRDFEGASIFFAATEMEAQGLSGRPAVVIGGANSAGQAALFLASRGSHVDLVVRGPQLSARMSDYLVRRINEHPEISVWLGTEVTALHGTDRLDAVDLSADGVIERRACGGLFCFIGAVPATAWLDGVALDEQGFVLTDSDLRDEHLSDGWTALGRRPFPYETSLPGVFAVGDVRRSSMKRVAAAVGEGSSAIMSVHRAIGIAA